MINLKKKKKNLFKNASNIINKKDLELKKLILTMNIFRILIGKISDNNSIKNIFLIRNIKNMTILK